MGWMALDLGGLTPILYSFIERDEIVDMLASMTGQRMLFNYFRIGGVNGDLNHEFMSRLGDWMGRAGEQIEANIGLLNENEIFVRRKRGLGTMDQKTALRMCHGPVPTCGPPASRSTSGGPTRTASTRSSISTSRRANEGDCLARYLLRMDEIKQSLRIIDQCLHQMPDGPIMAKLPRLLRPRPGRAYRRGRGAARRATRSTSSATAPTSRSASGSTTRAFIHLQSVGLMMPGHLIADTMAIMASLDPIMGGVDK